MLFVFQSRLNYVPKKLRQSMIKRHNKYYESILIQHFLTQEKLFYGKMEVMMWMTCHNYWTSC